MSPPTLSRRTVVTRLVLLVAMAAPGTMLHAEGLGRYRGIQKVEVFTHAEVPITQPKKPPFELKVWRLDGYVRAKEALNKLTPKNLTNAQKKEWQTNHNKAHPEFEEKWVDAMVESIEGDQVWRRGYSAKARGRVPAIVINGDWVMINETDVDRAIARYQAQNR